MSIMLFRLGRWAFRHAKAALAGAALVILALLGLAGVLGGQPTEVYTVPGTEGQTAQDSLAVRFPEVSKSSADIVVSAPPGQRITDVAAKTQVQSVVAALKTVPHVTTVMDPFDSRVHGAISADASTAVVTARLDQQSAEVSDETRDQLSAAGQPARAAGLRVNAGGPAFGLAAPELGATEGAGLLVALVVLLVLFRSVRAALSPLVSAIAGVAVTTSVVSLLAAATAVSSSAPLLAIMIGVAVGIDYALFVLSRHRELLADGVSPVDAAGRSLGTAGSAVVFAALTVMIALLALGVVGLPFLTTMGICAALGVTSSLLATLLIVPAVSGILGARLAPRRRVASPAASTLGDGFWGRWVDLVTRAPLATVAVVVVTLGLLALPAAELRYSLPTSGQAGQQTTQRQAYDTIAAKFGPGQNGPLLVSVDLLSTTDPLGVMTALGRDVAAVPGVARVALATPNASGETGIVVAIPTTGPDDAATRTLVHDLRRRESGWNEKYDVTTAVTGVTAVTIDVSSTLADALVPFLLLVVGLTLVILAVVFRSVLVPLIASLGYLLSLGAALGVVSLVFEKGHFAGVLGVTRLGPVISFMPVIVMGVLFGLAMDYQVFLTSRMHEDYAHHGNAPAAIRRGFVSVAPVVCAAAAIMVSVFAAFIPHGDAVVKPIALALTVGVLLDAVVIRMILVPAVLRLCGPAAWWFPARLSAALPALDVEGAGLARVLDHPPAVSTRSSRRLIDAAGLTLRGPLGVVYRDVTLRVDAGQVAILAGPEGSGKTALLLTLAGRMGFDDGRLVVDGALLPEQADQARRRVSLAEFPGINDLDPSLDLAHHVAERYAATALRPWASPAELDAGHELFRQLLQVARDAVPGCVPPQDPGPELPVGDLTALQRRIFGVALACLDQPAVVVVDDVSALHSVPEQNALWAVLRSVASHEGRAVLAATNSDAMPLESAAAAVVTLEPEKVTV